MARQTIGFGICLLALVFCNSYAEPNQSTANQTLTPFQTAAQKAPLLFVASAKESTIKSVNTQQQDYELILNDVDPTISYFSNRPQRIVGKLALNDFIKYWYTGKESFANVPPNAAFSAVTQDKTKQTSDIFILKKINYDAATKQLTFIVTALTPVSSDNSQQKFSFTNLYIDFNWHNNTP